MPSNTYTHKINKRLKYQKKELYPHLVFDLLEVQILEPKEMSLAMCGTAGTCVLLLALLAFTTGTRPSQYESYYEGLLPTVNANGPAVEVTNQIRDTPRQLVMVIYACNLSTGETEVG